MASMSELRATGLAIPMEMQRWWFVALAAEFVIVMVTMPRQRLIYEDDDQPFQSCVILWWTRTARITGRYGYREL